MKHRMEQEGASLQLGFISRGFLAGLAIAGVAFSYGCSITSTNPGMGSGAKAGTTGPVLDKSQFGQECSGGTSPGDSVAFQDSTCGAGVCVVDATGNDLNTYCSGDCTNAQCPSGYICQATTIGGTNDCFIDPNAPPSDGNDGGSSGSTTPATCAPLTGKYTVATTQDPTSTGTCVDLGTASADFDSPDPSCTNVFTKSSCNWASSCTPQDSEGETSTLSESIDTLALTGTLEMLTTQDGDGSVLSDCRYDLTLTKQ